MSPDRRRSPRPFVVTLVVVMVIAVAIVGWMLGRGVASSDADAAALGDAAIPVTSSTSPPATTTTTIDPRQVAGSRLPPGAATVFVLGDSVMLGAKDRVPAVMPGWAVEVDSKVNRRIDEGIDILAARRAPIARVLVVHLCTNWSGGDYLAEARRLLAAASGVERVVWLTCSPWRQEVTVANDVIRSLPDEFPAVVVADWAAIVGQPGYTGGDGIHLGVSGATAIASLVAGSVGPAPSPG